MLLVALGLASNRAVVGAFRPALPLSFLSSSPSRRKVDTARSNVYRFTRQLSSSNSNDDEPSKTGVAVDPNDKFAEYRNTNNIRDQVFSAISGDGGIKVTAATVRNLINDMMMKQTLTEVPTEALGRTAICALLMSNGIQDEQVVQITMNGTCCVLLCECVNMRCVVL